jgi:hypothetical protein
MYRNTWKVQILIRFAHYTCLLSDDSAARIARELWWTNQEFFLCRHHHYITPHVIEMTVMIIRSGLPDDDSVNAHDLNSFIIFVVWYI